MIKRCVALEMALEISVVEREPSKRQVGIFLALIASCLSPPRQVPETFHPLGRRLSAKANEEKPKPKQNNLVEIITSRSKSESIFIK